MVDEQLSGREPSGLRESIARMRAIPAKWKHLAHPIAEMQRIREDPFYDPWADPQWAVPFAPCCEACDCDVPTHPRSLLLELKSK